MSAYGVNPAGRSPLSSASSFLPGLGEAPGALRGGPKPGSAEAARTSSADVHRAAVRAPETVPVEPPPGTDPALWSVLTAEERSFFMHARALGPLTYRPGAAESPAAPALRGGRIDVRV